MNFKKTYGTIEVLIVDDEHSSSQTITVGCWVSLKAHLRMLVSSIFETPPSGEEVRERFSTAFGSSDWGSFASESELRGFSDYRRPSLIGP